MPRFVSVTDVNGIALNLNTNGINSIFPHTTNPSYTVVVTDGISHVVNDTVANILALAYGRASSFSSSFFSSPVATLATAKFTISGSATKTVRVKRFTVSGLQTTGGHVLFRLLKRSSDNTGGTFSNPTRVSHDSLDPGPTAVLKNFTANPTALGTLVGDLRSEHHFLPAAASIATNPPIFWDFDGNEDQAITLRGVSDILELNLNGTTIAGGSLDLTVEWTEE